MKANLDVSPMIAALRTSPEEFELSGDWLRHMPSSHNFQFDKKGNVRIVAYCNCSLLVIKRQQGVELWQTFQQWQASYWRPLQINKEFASHFRPHSAMRRLLIRFTEMLHRALVDGRLQRAHSDHRKLAVLAE